MDGFKHLSLEGQIQYLDGVHRYRKLIMSADLISVPTQYLQVQVEKLGKHSIVIPNTINSLQQSIALKLIQQPEQTHNEKIRIVYLSGSATHQADFAQCEQALLDLMHSYPNVVFRLVGFLDLDERWNKFISRIERVAFQPYDEMLKTLSECDINIAPLEVDNDFCNSKSELKFFEAGLVRIPTVASPTDTFNRAITHGVDGFLAHSHDDWKTHLSTLVESKELRKAIGEQARIIANSKYAVQIVARKAAADFGLEDPKIKARLAAIPKSPQSRGIKLAPGKLHITWVIPGLIIGGGGHRNILRAAYHLQQFGHYISLYFTGTDTHPAKLLQLIQEHFYPIDCPVYLFEGQINPCDAVFATHWSTVNAALTAKEHCREIMYFVQDFEPLFAPMGTEYVLAENTYRLGLYHITSGPWCEAVLRRDFNAQADHFTFPVDRSIYYPRTRNKKNKNLIFFAKPEMPRRCFELGIMTLEHLYRLRPDVEIIMFGSKEASKKTFGFPVTVREIVPTLDELAQMYSNGDLGLAFSTTNPSLIPYEMMACGLPVVDLNRNDNSINYDNRFDIAFLANPEPGQMAREISALIDNPEELAKRRTNGLAFVDTFPSEEQMAKRVEALILGRIETATVQV